MTLQCSRSGLVFAGAGALGAMLLVTSPAVAATEQTIADPLDLSGLVLEAAATRAYIWTTAEGFGTTDAFPEGVTFEQVNALGADDVGVGFAGTGTAFVWSLGGAPSLLPAGQNASSAALAIDTDGRVAGWIEDETGRHATLWFDGTLQRLSDIMPSDDGLLLTDALGFGPEGTILVRVLDPASGQARAALWHADRPLDLLDDIDGLVPVTGAAISSTGYVVGQAGEAAGGTGYLRRPDGTARLLSGPGGAGGSVAGVNTSGSVVGASLGDDPAAILWDATGLPTDLNDVIGNALPEGMRLVRADDINDAGQIAAYGLAADGSVHLLRLSPAGPDTAGNDTIPQPLFMVADLGEVYVDIFDQDLAPLALSSKGHIAGSCAPLAAACPIRDVDVALLDAEITNFFAPGTIPGGTIPVLPLFSGGVSGAGLGGSGGGTGGTGTGPTSGSGGTGPLQVPLSPRLSNFGPAPFTPLTGGGGGTFASGGSAASTASPVPLPASVMALLAALGSMLVFGRRNGKLPVRHRHSG